MVYKYGNYVIESDYDLYPLSGSKKSKQQVGVCFKIQPAVLEHRFNAAKWFLHIRQPDEIIFLSLGRTLDAFLLQFPGMATFQISPATSSIDCFAEESLPPHTLTHLLLDQVMPRLISHIGAMSLHASAVLVQDSAIMFCGESGWGKSTLALSFDQHGCPAFSDDVIMVEQDEAGFYAHAPYAGLRLWPQTISSLTGDSPETNPVSHYNSKSRVDVASSTEVTCAPLKCVFLLGDPTLETNKIKITPALPTEAVMALVKAKFRLETEDRAALQRELEQFSVLVEAIPFYHLDYPHQFSNLAQVREAVLRQLAQIR